MAKRDLENTQQCFLGVLSLLLWPNDKDTTELKTKSGKVICASKRKCTPILAKQWIKHKRRNNQKSKGEHEKAQRGRWKDKRAKNIRDWTSMREQGHGWTKTATCHYRMRPRAPLVHWAVSTRRHRGVYSNPIIIKRQLHQKKTEDEKVHAFIRSQNQTTQKGQRGALLTANKHRIVCVRMTRWQYPHWGDGGDDKRSRQWLDPSPAHHDQRHGSIYTQKERIYGRVLNDTHMIHIWHTDAPNWKGETNEEKKRKKGW